MKEPRPYLTLKQLAEVGPWSERAIRRRVSAGLLRRGFHFFQPGGAGGQLIFDWKAIEEYIRAGSSARSHYLAEEEVNALVEEAKTLLHS